MNESVIMNDLPHWEKIHFFGKIKQKCSKCKKSIDAEKVDIVSRIYCSNCGAKMDYIKM